MKEEKLYMKVEQSVEVLNKKVFLEDVAKLYSKDKNMVSSLNKQVVMVVDSKEEVKYCISIMKLIEIILKVYPDVEIINLGESDFVLNYKIPKKTDNLLEYLKTAFVCLTIFFGGAFSIMTFNTDVSVGDVFDKTYELVTGSTKTYGTILEVSYSIGLPVGVLVFFNHFSKKKDKADPTPIQIEMRKYEKDINGALIADASREGTTMDANN